jgi:hypothetical protein
MRHGDSRTVVLKARGRRARLGKQPLVATVGLGFADRGYQGALYRHPELYFGTLDANGETSLCGPRVSLRFQTHVVGSTDTNGAYDHPGPRGFLRCDDRKWVGCYGPSIRAEYGYSGHMRTITRIIALIERAREVTRTGRGDCELLSLIIGLQRCGVEIRIHRPDAVRLRSVA